MRGGSLAKEDALPEEMDMKGGWSVFPYTITQMTPRYLRRRKGQIFFVLVLLSLLLLLSNVNLTEHLLEQTGNCKNPCVGSFCYNCPQYTTQPVPVVNVLSHLKLKKALRSMSSNVSSRTQSVCKHMNFDLSHDSVKHLFFRMPVLNCSKEELFYLQLGVFKLNETVLKGQKLKKCMYMGIQRVTDDYSSYTETITQEQEPFDMKIQEDFVRIRCMLVTSDSDNKDKDENKDIEDGAIERIDKNIGREIDPENKNSKNWDSARKYVISQNKSAGYNMSHDRDMGGLNYKQNHFNLSRLNQSKMLNMTGESANKFRQRKLLVDDDGNVGVFMVAADDQPSDQQQDDTNDDNDDNENLYPGDDYGTFDYHDYFGDGIYGEADFDQFLVQIQPKPDVHMRIHKQLKAGLSDQRMNVLMLGFDSMSHLAFQRKLSKTYNYLKNELGSVILDSYNIVGDATTAALIPMLTGKAEDELPEVRKNEYDSSNVNVYPLIWNDFRDNGYVTMFAEDEPTIGVFNLRLNGFDKQPTDHYMRPFWQALWDSEVRKSSPRFCTGNVPHHMFLLDYTKDFFVKYSNVSKFAFVFGSELTHWDNNPGEYMDLDLLRFLTFLKVKGHLDNTLLILMADHGARYTNVRKTVQGKMEERLPFMSLYFPQWFRQKYPRMYRNLLRNSDHLTTPFDIHMTLRDVLDLKRTENRIKPSSKRMSLLKPIPWNRTCADAGIQVHWCACLKQLDLDTSDKHVQRSADVLLQFVNSKTNFVRNFCAKLKIKAVTYAYLLIPNEKVLMYQRSLDDDNRIANFSANINIDHVHFQVTIETYPNRGLFEGTIQVNMTAGSYTIMEEVSRIDMYGNQPRCVQEKYPDLRKYCYCYRDTKQDSVKVDM